MRILSLTRTLRRFPGDFLGTLRTLLVSPWLLPSLGLNNRPAAQNLPKNGPCSRTGILKYRVAHKITLSVILLALARVRKVGGSLVVTIPREVAEEEGVKAGELVNLEIRKTRKSFFGAARGIGPFTVEDEMKDHD